MRCRLLETTYPQLAVTLFQFRPAWFEQLLLRIGGIPHVVVNSSYAATEATGSLPYLRVLKNPNPILVGRHQPDQKERPHNCILKYLQSRPDWKVDELSESQQSQAALLETLIQSQLNPMLEVLRCQDNQAWDNVYRPQHVQAGSAQQKFWLVGSWFQSWSVRVVSRQQHSGKWTLEQAKAIAKPAYSKLETLLATPNALLLNTTKPSVVDALLWAHLADALCDVYLVTILADFPNLVRFFQDLYNKYFQLGDSPDEIEAWNWEQNQQNAFQHLPLERRATEKMVPFKSALELMQFMSVHTLSDTLATTKLARSKEIRPAGKPPSTWYRWCMGGELYPPPPPLAKATPESASEPQAKWKTEQRQNDELWLSGVLTVTSFALLYALQQNGE